MQVLFLKKNDVHFLRGGAFKPLTFPYRSKQYFETREKGINWFSNLRNKIKIPDGWSWLTVPINKEHKFLPNKLVEINNKENWKEMHWKKIINCQIVTKVILFIPMKHNLYQLKL